MEESERKKILIKDKQTGQFVDATGNVKSIERCDRGWRICFNTSSKAYNYPDDSVRLLNFEIKRDTANGFGTFEPDPKKTTAENLMSYLVQFCYCQNESAPIVSEEETDGETETTPFKLIGESLSKVDVKSSALSRYLNATVSPQKTVDLQIFPFGCNGSQKEAVKNALANPISIIEGPPGTGKTQTILNIIANLLVQNKTIAVVSNNNSAVSNVAEKLASVGLDWLIAKLGRKALRERFFSEGQSEIHVEEDWMVKDFPMLKQRIQSNFNLVDQIFSKQVDLQRKTEELGNFRHELEVFYKEHNADIKEIESLSNFFLQNHFSTYRLQDIKLFILHHAGKAKWYDLIKWFYFFRLKIWKPNQFLAKDEFAIYALNRTLLITVIGELENEIRNLQIWLQTNAKSVVKEFVDDSMSFFKHTLYNSFRCRENVKLDERCSISELVSRYPIVTSSTFSLKASSGNTGFRYDYLIIDEASQVNLPTAALCFSVSNNVVIVGDSHQLPHIVDTNTLQLGPTMHPAYDAVKQSILTSCKLLFGKKIPVTLLKEHYRCHPLIVDFCNRRFYNNEMVIMSADDGHFPFETVEVNDNEIKHSSGGSCYNERQALETNDIVNHLVEEGVPESQIGVIAPYRAHSNRVKALTGNIESDTVHKFQGREKDVIIYNSVMGSTTPFNDNPNLINVAVSRAKSKFIVVAPPSLAEKKDSNLASLINYIHYKDPECLFVKTSKRSSIFDALYGDKTYLGIIQEKRKGKESPAETIFRLLLEKILRSAGSKLSWNFKQEYYLIDLVKSSVDLRLFKNDEIKYMLNGARLDFLIYDTINQNPILAIEIDGGHHQQAASKRKDLLKDHILEILSIPCKRFNTATVEGREELVLRETLNELYRERN